MQNVRAHVREFPQFFIGYAFDLDGMLDDAGVAGQKTAHVRPVFVQIRVHRRRDDGTADIAAAAGKSLDIPLRVGTVESGNDRASRFRQRAADQRIGSLFVETAFPIEKHDVLRVDKGNAERRRYDARVEIFSAGCGEIHALASVDLPFRFPQDRLDVHIQTEFFDNGVKTLFDFGERFRTIALFNALFITGV